MTHAETSYTTPECTELTMRSGGPVCASKTAGTDPYNTDDRYNDLFE